jgi:hypothetical protein
VPIAAFVSSAGQRRHREAGKMSDSREQRIRERAHSLWESEGSPEGRHEEFWFRAERLIAAEDSPEAPTMTDTPPL